MKVRVKYFLLLTFISYLFHENIIDYCGRPFKNSDKMWNAIKRNWNAVVQPEDQVFIVGDLTLKKTSHKGALCNMLDGLKGTKHLIIGNHDLMHPRDYEDIGFTSVHYPGIYLTFGDDEFLVAHDPSLANVLKGNQSLICGHQHGTLFNWILNDKGRFVVDVGVDVWDFTPVSIDMIKGLKADLLNELND